MTRPQRTPSAVVYRRVSSGPEVCPPVPTPACVLPAGENKDRSGGSGKTGFMPLAAPQMPSGRAPTFNQQPVQCAPRPVQQKRRRGRGEEEEPATSSDGTMDAAALISPPQLKRSRQQATLSEHKQKQRQVGTFELRRRDRQDVLSRPQWARG